jgi:hypothetical protein
VPAEKPLDAARSSATGVEADLLEAPTARIEVLFARGVRAERRLELSRARSHAPPSRTPRARHSFESTTHSPAGTCVAARCPSTVGSAPRDRACSARVPILRGPRFAERINSVAPLFARGVRAEWGLELSRARSHAPPSRTPRARHSFESTTHSLRGRASEEVLSRMKTVALMRKTPTPGDGSGRMGLHLHGRGLQSRADPQPRGGPVTSRAGAKEEGVPRELAPDRVRPGLTAACPPPELSRGETSSVAC